MDWAKLIAVVDGGPGSEAVARAAIGLGRTFQAHVEMLHVEVPPDQSVPAMADGLTAGSLEQLIEGLQERAAARAEAAEKACQSVCQAEGVALSDPDAPPPAGALSAAFRRVSGREADEVARRGRLADLTLVAGSWESEAGTFAAALEAALFETGGPVLMVPEGAPATFGGSIALAWDGTLEAARAARAALPLLARAEKIFILTADMEKAHAKPSEMAAFLAARGIEARTWAFLPESRHLGDDLLEEAGKAGADLLVMGAYAHSRLRELVLGGVTRTITAKARIPVLMAH